MRLSQWIERVMGTGEYSPFRLVLEKDVVGAKGSPVQAVSYRPLKYGEEYVDKGTAQYEEKYERQKLKQAAKHGFALVPVQDPS